jgi:hypothetical protein
MNINLSPEDQKTRRLEEHAEIPAAGDALQELDAARAATARAQAKLDAATAVAAEWDALRSERVDVRNELADLHRHLADMKQRLEEDRVKVFKRLVAPLNVVAGPVSQYALVEKLVKELLPAAIRAKEKELSEVEAEIFAFVETHKIAAAAEQAPTSASTSTESASENSTRRRDPRGRSSDRGA